MHEDRLIDAYLDELAAALTVPGRVRRRALAEARDHLLCASADREAEGAEPAAAERAAVSAYGDASTVARRFAEELAVDSAQRATRLSVAACAAFCVFFAVSTQIGPARTVSPFAEGLPGAIGWFAAQIAATCAGLSAVRTVRHQLDVALPAGKLRYINRGCAVALGAVLVSVLADGVAALADPAGPAGGAAAWRAVGLLALGAVGAVSVVALGLVVRAQGRTRALALVADAPAGDDALDDVQAVLAALERVPVAGTLIAWAGRTLSSRPLTTVWARLGLRAHPWRFCAAAAVAAGAVLTAAHLVGEGLPADGALVALAVAGVFIGIEGAAIALCFALLGRFLGIRAAQNRPPGHATPA